MKKVTVLLAIVVIPVWFFAYFFLGQNIKIHPKLEETLLERLEVNHLSSTLFESVESLDLSSANLTSIEGIEHFKNLKELNLRNNLIEDATPIEQLENLEILDLRFNQLADLNTLPQSLKKLDLEGNRLTSIAFLSTLTELQTVNIRDNFIADLLPLENLTKLKNLNIRNNQVKSLEPITNLEKLQDFNARNNQIESVEPLVNLPLEKRITLEGNPIHNYYLLEDVIERTDETDIPTIPTAPTTLTPSGFYKEEVEVKLRAPEHHQIFYTLDGTMPTLKSESSGTSFILNEQIMKEQQLYANIPSSSVYEAPLQDAETVKKAITVTAVSYLKGQYSKPATFTYIFDETLQDSNLPIISLAVDPKSLFDEQEGIYVPGNLYREGYQGTGNYYGKGKAYEKEASFEYFNEEGDLSVRQRVGIRINGGHTRVFPQKSLRLYSRAEYGQSRFYSKFFKELPYFEHNLLLLRNSGNDNYSTMIRDGLMQELVKDRKMDLQAYQPTILLVNGEYWGIHNLREKYNANYIDIKYNVKPADLVMMSHKPGNKINFEMDSGVKKDANHYFEMIEFMGTHDLRDDENLAMIHERMDVENYFEYVAAQVYFANTDSFYNNLMLWRKKANINEDGPYGHDGRWRWMLYDTDFGMGYGLLSLEGNPIEFDMLAFVLRDDDSVFLFRELMKNEQLKQQFTMTLLDMLANNFETDLVQQKIDTFSDRIRPEMPRTIERWGNIESMEQWEENIDLLKQFAKERPALVKGHIQKNFGYTEAQLKEMEDKISTHR